MLANSLIRDHGDNDKHHNFLEYFENTWVGRERRNPRFQKDMWNCKEITELQLPRTTNSLESWHRTLQNTFGCLHPTFYKLIDGLLQENVHANAICVKLDGGDEVPLYTRREYQQANERLLTIIERYAQTDADSYLAACSHYIRF